MRSAQVYENPVEALLRAEVDDHEVRLVVSHAERGDLNAAPFVLERSRVAVYELFGRAIGMRGAVRVDFTAVCGAGYVVARGGEGNRREEGAQEREQERGG